MIINDNEKYMLNAQKIDKMNGELGWTEKEKNSIFIGKNTKLVYQIEKNTDAQYNGLIMQAVDQDNFISPQESADEFAKEFNDKLFEHLTPRMMKALLKELAKNLTEKEETKEEKKQELKNLIDNL